jgi:hypothetical protein
MQTLISNNQETQALPIVLSSKPSEMNPLILNALLEQLK